MATQILIPITTITFPEIALRPHDAHKLRGYFGNLFRDHSPLLHNHLDSDPSYGLPLTNELHEDQQSTLTKDPVAVRFRYGYPLVQYKVLKQQPTLVGFGEGAGLLTQLFLKMREINLEQDGVVKTFPVLSKHICQAKTPIGTVDDLIEYQFETLWIAFNQANYRDYRSYSAVEQQAQLKRVLTSQILAVFREFGLWLPAQERIMLRLSVQERTTQFKNQTMIAFAGSFLANVVLPDGLGLGKAVSRGFGSVKQRRE